jgi:hypothetical protein
MLGETTPLAQWNPQIPERLSDLILNCLEVEPAKRKYMTYVLKQLEAMAPVVAAK